MAARKTRGTKDKKRVVVLLVDDYEDNRDLYAEYLVHVGYEVCLASNGEEAIACAKANAPDFIVMDLSMPVLDGWEATRRIRMEQGERAPYIIALSGFADRSSRKRALEAGCDEFIAKPLLPSELVKRLRELESTRRDR